jgi:transcriptional regulator with XRE-family HTH domain
MLLAEVRKLAGKSQSDLANILGIKQPSLSKLESQDDMRISTLKKIVEALGGRVEIIARFPGEMVRLRQFQKPGKAAGRARKRRSQTSSSSRLVRKTRTLQLG